MINNEIKSDPTVKQSHKGITELVINICNMIYEESDISYSDVEAICSLIKEYMYKAPLKPMKIDSI